jgi:cell division protein FtsL
MGTYFRLATALHKRVCGVSYLRSKRKLRLRASDGRLVLGVKSLSLTVLAMLVIVSVSFVALVNIRVTKGFEINDLEIKIAELEKNNDSLSRRVADYQSIQNIQQRVDLKNFVPTTNVSYLKPADYAFGTESGSTP